MVVLGLVMILIGLMMPVLGRSMERSRRTARLSTIRQHMIGMSLYAEDFQDSFPYFVEHPYRIAKNWHVVMTGGRYVPARRTDIDAYGTGLDGQIGLAMSVAMVYDFERMMPGKTVPVDSMKSSAQKFSATSFPSSKAALFRYWVKSPSGNPAWWCCGPPPREEGEVAMVDGSADFGDWTEYFSKDYPDRQENEIGQPVVTTWFGIHGRDRP